MKFASFAYSTLGLITAGTLVWSCSSKSRDCNANLDCAAFGGTGASGSAGKSGASGTSGSGDSGARNEAGQAGASSGSGGSTPVGGSGGGGGAACVGTASPDTTNCVIGDDYGLFVSLSGDDAAGDGTEAHPLATVTKALSLTGPNNLNRIYVCATPNGVATAYAEPGTIVIPDRVSIYGGFTCDGGIWNYDTTVAAHLKPASPIGAQIDSVKNGVVLQDLRIDATAAAEDGTGASSFGMIVNASKGVVLTRVEIHAGKGGGGAKGADGMTAADGSSAGALQNGLPAQCGPGAPASQDGGKSIAKKCGSQGGNGGTAFTATTYSQLQDGAGGFQVDPTNGGKGSDSAGQAGKVGSPGLNGAAGKPGEGAALAGTFSTTGYVGAKGGSGTVGMPGFGGGGGGSSLGSASCVGASGAAGGMGGCGGDLGGGGNGGGASIALLSWGSEVSLDTCTLVTGAGGAGGNGGRATAGGLGKPGGNGGAADGTNGIGKGGGGGDGGDGGNGGCGAGGTGGPSIALVFSGNEPSGVAGSTLTPADGGALGVGGHLGLNSANWGPDGSKGLSQAVFEQK